jgi:hypothetical protein
MYNKAPYFVLLIVALSFVAAVILMSRSPQKHATSTVAPFEYIPPKGYVCYRASSPITIDGSLDDPAWQAIPWTEDFVDIEGAKKPKPPLRTRVKMAWDDDCLYIAAELEEPHVWATLTQHDSYIFHEDNDFEVFLDPDGDNHLYAELEMNAKNTTWDLLLTKPYRDEGHAIDAWEIAGLKTAVQVNGTLNDASDTDKGWTIEIAWPWKGLKQLSKSVVPPVDGDQWRINFSRVELEHSIVDGKYRRLKGIDNWVWSPQGVVDMHRPELWGYLQFSTAPPGRAEFRPDRSGPVRAYLQRIYYAQADFRKAHGYYARSLAELDLPDFKHESMLGLPMLEVTQNYFEATAMIRLGEQKFQRWHIRSDSRVWADVP